MKKLIGLLALLVCLPMTAYAIEGFYIDTYISDNTTGYNAVTYVSASTVNYLTDKILGFEVLPLSLNSENVASLYDASTSSEFATANNMGEVECLPESFDGLWYPHPKYLRHGLCISQGAQTRVTVFYTRY